MNKEDFEAFLFRLKETCREKIHNKNEGQKWDDKQLRYRFYRIAIDLFKEKFPNDEAKGYIYGEGQGEEGKNRIPIEYRNIKFMDSDKAKAPDAALINKDTNFALAIELDHGTKGSQLLNALSKASMTMLLEKNREPHSKGFNRVLLLFVDEGNLKLKNYEKDKDYIIIRDWFKKKPLSTEVLII